MGLIAFDDVNWNDEHIKEFAFYWYSLWQKGEIPYQSAFDPSKVRHLLPGITIYELKLDGAIRCRLLGAGLAEQFGWDFTGRNFLDLLEEESREIARESFKTVLNLPCGFYSKISCFTENDFEVTGLSVGFPGLDESGDANRLIFYSKLDERHTVREPRKDKVLKIVSSGQCFISLDQV